MARWIEPEEYSPENPPDPALGLSDLLIRLLADRGVTADEQIRAYLDPTFYKPSPAYDLPGMVEGVHAVRQVINGGGTIGVWGDFDVDGQTSTSLLVSALRKLGAEIVYHIPVRGIESHGIKIPFLKEFMENGIDLLLTCDTGISANEAVGYAQKMGVRVVITDHHDLPETLPEAEAVINPKLLPETHPLAALPGVGVAYKFIEALYQEYGLEAELENFLDLVALGIVADVAELVADTRYLLQIGLNQLRKTKRLGLQALFENNDLVPERITEEEIGYVIAPRLNALGRLGDANPIVEFLTTQDRVEADVTAEMLEGLNARRKNLSDHVYEGVLAELGRHPEFAKEAAIVLSNDHWPPGVVGIVASRLVDKYQKPVVLLKISEDGIARGSARSVDGCDISEALRNCSDLLDGFGGHPMAAGLALNADGIGRFRRKLSGEVVKQVGEDVFEPVLTIDQFVQLDEINLSMVQDVSRLGPFGNGNPPVCFAVKNVSLAGQSFLGRNQAHRKLVVEDEGGKRQSVLWWQSSQQTLPKRKFDLAFTARENVFRGDLQLQIVLEDFREGEESVSKEKLSSRYKFVDLRQVMEPMKTLRTMLSSDKSILVWGEGPIGDDLKYLVKGRNQLVPSDRLIIWTAPPDYRTLKSVIEDVQPSELIVFGMVPEAEATAQFLHRLTGLVKYVISSKEGVVRIVDLAAATAQTELIVRLGLSWLEASGNVVVNFSDGGGLEIRDGDSRRKKLLSSEVIEQDLEGLLAETRYFREYFRNCSIDEFSSLGE